MAPPSKIPAPEVNHSSHPPLNERILSSMARRQPVAAYHLHDLEIGQAIVSAVTSGSKRFFHETDSAPHYRRTKECDCGCAGIYNAHVSLSVYAKVFEEAGALDKLEAFTSFNGPDFYGLPRNTSKIKMTKAEWRVPESFSYASGHIIPMFAGEKLDWFASYD